MVGSGIQPVWKWTDIQLMLPAMSLAARCQAVRKSFPWHVCLHGPADWTQTGRRLQAFLCIFAFMGQLTLASHGAPSAVFSRPFSVSFYSHLVGMFCHQACPSLFGLGHQPLVLEASWWLWWLRAFLAAFGTKQQRLCVAVVTLTLPELLWIHSEGPLGLWG